MILITGSSGFIGSHLMDYFEDAIGIDKREDKRSQNTLKVNLLDLEQLIHLFKDMDIDYVFHEAARPSVPDSYSDPNATYLDNVAASVTLFQACKVIGVKKIIFASSSSVYGESPYGHSKRIGEEILKNTGIPYTILRYFNVFGPRQRNNVVSHMYNSIKNNMRFEFYGDGKTSRDFTYVSNVVLANELAMDSKYDGKILEVGTGESHSLLHLFKTIKREVNPFFTNKVFEPIRIGDIRYSKSDTFLPKKDIIHMEEGVREWLKSEK